MESQVVKRGGCASLARGKPPCKVASRGSSFSRPWLLAARRAAYGTGSFTPFACAQAEAAAGDDEGQAGAAGTGAAGGAPANRAAGSAADGGEADGGEALGYRASEPDEFYDIEDEVR